MLALHAWRNAIFPFSAEMQLIRTSWLFCYPEQMGISFFLVLHFHNGNHNFRSKKTKWSHLAMLNSWLIQLIKVLQNRPIHPWNQCWFYNNIIILKTINFFYVNSILDDKFNYLLAIPSLLRSPSIIF